MMITNCPEFSQKKRVVSDLEKKKKKERKRIRIGVNKPLALIGSCAHGQSFLCLQLRADETKGSIQWKMTSFMC